MCREAVKKMIFFHKIKNVLNALKCKNMHILVIKLLELFLKIIKINFPSQPILFFYSKSPNSGFLLESNQL